LVTALRITKTYSTLVPRLAAALTQTKTTQIIDLCSGAGGPWPQLLPELRVTGTEVSVCLTDKYPNLEALKRVSDQVSGLRFESESISAMEVPSQLIGFRTIFTAFHHFQPKDAQAILASAVRDRQGIAIAEAASRKLGSLALMLLVPLAVLLMTPRIRPFRWSRLFWTYLIPIIPIAVLFDGIVSCLRIYTPEEMLSMAHKVDNQSYDWESGIEYPPGSPILIPYLIGIPRSIPDPN
jgi:hypothetical protein